MSNLASARYCTALLNARFFVNSCHRAWLVLARVIRSAFACKELSKIKYPEVSPQWPGTAAAKIDCGELRNGHPVHQLPATGVVKALLQKSRFVPPHWRLSFPRKG